MVGSFPWYDTPFVVQVSQKHFDDAFPPLEEQTLTPVLHHENMFESESGQASVFLYKREGDSAAEILQPLISQDPRHFR